MSLRHIKRFFCTFLVFLLLQHFTLVFAQEDVSEQLLNTAMELLLSEDSTEVDMEEGINTLYQAMWLNNSDAAYILGYIYEIGYWVEQDYSMALSCYYQCADYDIDALFKIGYFFEYGLGIEQDFEQARTIYQIAAQYDHIEAMKELAHLYLLDIDTPQKATDAKNLFERAAQLGDLEAMHFAGWCYEYGIGTELDYKQASKYYIEALELNEKKAYFGKNPRTITRKLQNILKNDSTITESYCKAFYEAIFIRKYATTANTSTDSHIEEVMASLYPTLNVDQRIKAIRECINWIYKQDPELKEKISQLGYGYSQLTKYERSAISDLFYYSGYMAFEERDFINAESNYKFCIGLDPRDIEARFELVETYIGTGQFDKAIQELNNSIPYIRDSKDKAHYYRRLGFIAIDEQKYDLGGACMHYSLCFFQSENALNELKYIKKLTGIYPEYELSEIIQIFEDNSIYIWAVER